MTDQELIARLRDEHVSASRTEAADHIERTEAKLAKAVELLILCRDMFGEVAHPSDPLSVMIKTTLAELEGKDHG